MDMDAAGAGLRAAVRDVAAYLGMPVRGFGTKHQVLYCASPFSFASGDKVGLLRGAPRSVAQAVHVVGRAPRIEAYEWLSDVFRSIESYDRIFVRGDVLAWLCCVAHVGTARDAFQVLPRLVLHAQGAGLPPPPYAEILLYALARVHSAGRAPSVDVRETDAQKQAFRALYRPWEPRRVPVLVVDDVQAQADALYAYFVAELNVAPAPHGICAAVHSTATHLGLISPGTPEPGEPYVDAAPFGAYTEPRGAPAKRSVRAAEAAHLAQVLEACSGLDDAVLDSLLDSTAKRRRTMLPESV